MSVDADIVVRGSVAGLCEWCQFEYTRTKGRGDERSSASAQIRTLCGVADEKSRLPS